MGIDKLSFIKKINAKDAGTLFNWKYGLTGPAKAAVGVTALLGTGLAVSKNMTNVNKIGPIRAGKLSDMTDSVAISEGVTKIANGKGHLHNSLRNYGATGDIVFALHNMR